MTDLSCRICDASLGTTFVDLGASPLSNSYLRQEQLQGMEPFYPLRVFVCDQCLLVQLPELEKAENIFDQDYAYFSSVSSSWLAHCEQFAQEITEQRGLNQESLVVEIASNDGYLLQYFKALKIRVLGVEPAASVAEVAQSERGIPTLQEFFGEKTATKIKRESGPADLLIGNNVLAHVPDLQDFLRGVKVLLAKTGVCTFEFPHLLQMMEHCQFDTIYHEHFSYLSLVSATRAFQDAGLEIFDVKELPTHGGSLRVYLGHPGAMEVKPGLAAVQAKEQDAQMQELAAYRGFKTRVDAVKHHLLELLISEKRAGRSVAGYGAPAKGNTLLNYCGIRHDLIEYTVDKAESKQGLFLPGTRIPILKPNAIAERKPDTIVILPWNIRAEILRELDYTQAWGARFIVPIPEPAFVS